VAKVALDIEKQGHAHHGQDGDGDHPCDLGAVVHPAVEDVDHHEDRYRNAAAEVMGQQGEALEEADPGAASLARYLHGRGGGFPVYQNTEVTYFPGGEAKFAELLRQLEKAERYIFLEYFIIDEGLMWGKILEVLARKAAEGVDVRVMYGAAKPFAGTE